MFSFGFILFLIGLGLFIGTVWFYVAWQAAEKKTKQSYQEGFVDGDTALRVQLDAYLQTTEQIDRHTFAQAFDLTPIAPGPTTELPETTMTMAEASGVQQMFDAPTQFDTPLEIELEPSEEETAAKNQNILLFVASLLLVAAAAAFVGTTMSDAVKFIGIWFAVAMFYGVGMALHGSERLRPAGVAFIGISLGALPFAGISLYELAGIPGVQSWLITSVIGVVAYFYAAIKLQSQVVSYLTMAFVVSMAAAFGESMSLPLMWTFVSIISLSLAMNIISMIRPNWVPEIFSKPIEHTGRYLTPVALAGSILLLPQLELFDYEVILGVATLQYLVIWLQARTYENEFIVRLMAQILAMVVAWDFTSGGADFGAALVVSALLQQLISLARYPALKPKEVVNEIAWYHILQVIQLAALATWISHDQSSVYDSVGLAAIGLSSLALTLRSRTIVAAITGLLVSLWLPATFVRDVLELDWSVVAGIYIALTAAITYLWQKVVAPRSESLRVFMLIAMTIYAVLGAITALVDDSMLGVAPVVLVGALLWLASFITKQAFLSVIGSVVIAIGFTYFWRIQEYGMTWQMLALAAFMFAWLYPLYVWLGQRGDTARSLSNLVVLWAILIVAIVTSSFADDTKMTAAGAIIVLAATIAYEAYRRNDASLKEVAFYTANIGLLRMIGIAFPELNIVFYAHWSAVAVALMAWYSHTNRTNRLQIALGLVTVSTGIYALASGGTYQLLFLVEHVLLLLAGALLKKDWMMLWGGIASSLAVIYFLRDLAFLWLAFLGFAVIGIVIWQIMKKPNS